LRSATPLPKWEVTFTHACANYSTSFIACRACRSLYSI
jgi:hypothetical protein